MSLTMYIDELGESSPKRYKNSSYFILTGCVMNDDNKRDLMNNLDHIKFKFWDTTEIILHSKLIGRKEKEFEIFKNNISLFKSFTQNLADFFRHCPMYLLSVAVDQQVAFRNNWDQRTVIIEPIRK